jgi:DNA-binding response OmpR family regulator
MKKIALIEDEATLFTLLQCHFEKEGFVLVGAQSGIGAIELFERESPDLILLDTMLADSDGLDIFRSIRAHPELGQIPVILLTTRGPENDRLAGLELGANDYIIKPFFIRELIGRVEIRLRYRAPAFTLLKAGPLEMDRSIRRVRLGSQPVSLTAKEFRLLEFMMSHPGVVFRREQLLEAVWGHDYGVNDRTVDVHILHLRQKIDLGPSNRQLIRSVRGLGYGFNHV